MHRAKPNAVTKKARDETLRVRRRARGREKTATAATAGAVM